MKASIHGSEARTQTSSAFVNAAETQRLATLSDEQKKLAERMRQIQTESEAIFASMKARIAPEFIVSSGFYGHRRQPDHPRPIHDKLVISAGRAIVTGLRKGNSPEQSKDEAIRAATRVAARYGLGTLPADVVSSIEKKIQTRYNLFHSN
jgi:hypothetical protein